MPLDAQRHRLQGLNRISSSNPFDDVPIARGLGETVLFFSWRSLREAFADAPEPVFDTPVPE
jgi:hypothetical protein